MCGIAGCFGTVPLDDERVRRTLDLMRRRGPDKRAFKTFATDARHVTLLHSRLSIIDLDDRAHQPFNIGAKWLTFNGELYNYVELRDELKGEGHVFTTQSDTEVLLRVIDA